MEWAGCYFIFFKKKNGKEVQNRSGWCVRAGSSMIEKTSKENELVKWVVPRKV